MKFLDYLRNFKKKFSCYRPVVDVIIYRKNLLHNLNEFKKFCPDQRIAPVLKSNAYGHGLVTVAQIVEDQDIPFVAVDSLFEAQVLRVAGIKIKILVIGFTPVENIVNVRLRDVSFTLTSLEQIKQLAAIQGRITNVHIKIDTGMNRQGIVLAEIPAAIQAIKNNKFLLLEGVCSHFANAHNQEQQTSHDQILNWEAAVTLFKNSFASIKFFHIANTAGSFYANNCTSNVVRLGIGWCGFNASPFVKMDLRPVLSLGTMISGIKKLKPGDGVGYNNSFRADKECLIATIPVGYYECLDRRLANRGVVLVHDQECKIVGDVSMNITTIDVTNVSDVKIGDRVVVVSNVPTDKNSEENISRLIGTIPYEMLTRIPQHLRRRISD